MSREIWLVIHALTRGSYMSWTWNYIPSFYVEVITYPYPHLNSALGDFLDSKVHGANMGTIWGRQTPGGPHVGPMNFAIWTSVCKRGPYTQTIVQQLTPTTSLAGINSQRIPNYLCDYYGLVTDFFAVYKWICHQLIELITSRMVKHISMLLQLDSTR